MCGPTVLARMVAANSSAAVVSPSSIYARARGEDQGSTQIPTDRATMHYTENEIVNILSTNRALLLVV